MDFLASIPADPLTLLLLDTLAQVTAITLLALLVMRTAARRSPAARHGIALCALFCVLSSPAIAGGVERVGRADVVVGAAQQGAPLHPLTGGLLLVWLLGVVWQLARFAAGWAWLARLRRSVSALDLKDRAHVLEDVCRAVGRYRVPALGVSPLVPGPVVLGPFQPMIVLPLGMERTLDDAALRDILIHEWAHLVQNHHVLGWAQRCAATLFWPHPLVHALCREFGQSAEELCDNFVLRHSAAPQYARTLLTVASSGAPRALPAGSPAIPFKRGETRSRSSRWLSSLPVSRPQSGRLVARVEGLLDRTRERRTQWDLWKQVVLTSLFLAIATSVSAMRVSQAAARPDGGIERHAPGPGLTGGAARRRGEQPAPAPPPLPAVKITQELRP